MIVIILCMSRYHYDTYSLLVAISLQLPKTYKQNNSKNIRNSTDVSTYKKKYN